MNDTPAQAPSEPKHYFVDEAGDATLFSGRGRVLVGSAGCSRFFMVGLLDVAEPERLATALNSLRATLLADPYFRGVPSMQPAAGKTARFFHAAEDVPEVRREVFRVLAAHRLRFSAVVKNKARVLEYVRSRNALAGDYRYRPDELYDLMLRRLFKQRLHRHTCYRVCFARRGHSDRTAAFRTAIETARQRFAQDYGIDNLAAVEVIPANPWQAAGLQAVDYFLWALQRTYERREERYLHLLWPQFSLVIDIDDTRQKPYGEYYTAKKPLVAAALEAVEGYRSK